MTVGDAAGNQLGEAHIESTMDAGGQPIISFQVTETLLGTVADPGIEVGPAAVARHADPKLADFDPECMPGLSEGMKAFMATKEARYWLQQFVDGMVSEEVIGSRFGTEVLELFQMWLAIQEDMDAHVRNCADAIRTVAETAHEDEGEGSDATTIAVGDEQEANARAGYVAPEGERNTGEDGSSHASVAEGEAQNEAGEEKQRSEGINEGGTADTSGAEPVTATATDVERADRECRDEHCEGQDRLDGDDMEEDELDPETGIPARWVAFWRATCTDASIGVGVGAPEPVPAPGIVEGSLSDGFGTLPENEIESGAVELAPAAAEMPSTESHASSSTEGQKQSDLKCWLK